MSSYKSILLIFILIFSLFTSCTVQEYVDSEDLRFEEVVILTGQDKDKIFVKARSWCVDNFVNSESVIQYSDKEAGIIKGKYTSTISDEWSGSFLTMQTITIDVKEGKLRFRISDPQMKATVENKYQKRNWHPIERQKYIEEIRLEWMDLYISLSDYVEKDDVEW